MNNQLQLATFASPIGSLDAYIHQVNRIPILTLEEEVAFAERYLQGDIDSARHLVLAHLRYVVSVARGYLGYGLPLGDLIQEGNVGLMKAVKRFDPKMGVRLVSFAIHWIKSEIHEYVLRNWRIVKVATTKAQRKLFFNLRQMKDQLGWLNKQKAQYIASELGVKEEEVFAMEQRLHAVDASYDGPHTEDDDDAFKAPANVLYESHNDPAQIVEKERSGERGREGLHYALERLDERSQDILQQRWLNDEKATLHDLADQYGVSAERVRQLEKNAMKKLREYMEESVQ